MSIAALAGYTTLTGIDVFLARHFLAPVAAGRYAAAAIAGHIAMFLPGALVTVAFPRLASANATGTSARKTLTETLGLVTVIGLAAFAVLAGMPGVVVDVLFGPKYLGAASIVGIIALISVLLGIIGLLTYFHVARRSVAALYSWAGVALVWVLVAVLHGGMETIADCMLAASGFVLVAVSLPALAAVVRPVSGAAVLSDGAVELPPAEIDLSLISAGGSSRFSPFSAAVPESDRRTAAKAGRNTPASTTPLAASMESAIVLSPCRKATSHPYQCDPGPAVQGGDRAPGDMEVSQQADDAEENGNQGNDPDDARGA